MTIRNLILIHRGHEYERDFEDIAAKIHARDGSINIYRLAASLRTELPADAWRFPTLTVSLAQTFRLPIRRGPVMRNQKIEKLAQHAVFVRHAIPAPPALPFQFGMLLDPILFGDLVILKPMDLEQTSKGDGVHLIRRRRLHQKKLTDFPADHPIQKAKTGYIVQRFVDTGEYPSFYRVQTFLGKAIYAWHSTLVEPRCSLTASDEEIERTIIATQGGGKSRRLMAEADVIAIAERVHAAFPHVPMLAVDVIREAQSGRLFVLECNPGGNTWHFSSEIGEKLRLGFGNAEANGPVLANEIARRMFIEQFGAFDIVAERLVQATRTQAA